MKKTALYNKHIEFQAKMIPFAGYEMPIQYSGVNHEHINVRNNVPFISFIFVVLEQWLKTYYANKR